MRAWIRRSARRRNCSLSSGTSRLPARLAPEASVAWNTKRAPTGACTVEMRCCGGGWGGRREKGGWRVSETFRVDMPDAAGQAELGF